MIDKVGVEWVYVDVMDGRFVLNIMIGLLVVDVIWLVMDKVLDCYLMIVELEFRVVDFVKVGVDIIFVYVEGVVMIYLYCIIN